MLRAAFTECDAVSWLEKELDFQLNFYLKLGFFGNPFSDIKQSKSLLLRLSIHYMQKKTNYNRCIFMAHYQSCKLGRHHLNKNLESIIPVWTGTTFYREQSDKRQKDLQADNTVWVLRINDNCFSDILADLILFKTAHTHIDTEFKKDFLLLEHSL
jgi:hypothetical protein